MASAAESGWDFSTRWFHDHHHMKSIKTQDIIPVDLNAILCATERLLSKLYDAVGSSLLYSGNLGLSVFPLLCLGDFQASWAVCHSCARAIF